MAMREVGSNYSAPIRQIFAAAGITFFVAVICVTPIYVRGQGLGVQSASQGSLGSTSVRSNLKTVYFTPVYKAGPDLPEIQPTDISILEAKTQVDIRSLHCGKPEPLRLGVLVDMSGSRRQDLALKDHYNNLETFLMSVPGKDDTTFLGAFNERVYPLADFTSDRGVLKSAVDSLRRQVPVSSTALYDAINFLSTSDFAGRKGRRVVVVIGDFSDNSSRFGVMKTLENLQRSSTTLFVIDDGLEVFNMSKKAVHEARDMAILLTERTGGKAFIVENKSQFNDALVSIGKYLNGFCALQYESVQDPANTKLTSLKIGSNRRDVVILAPEEN